MYARESGILMPVFSLPGKYGIGCFSKEAYAFVDFLKKSGQRYWQVLPLGQTGFGDSPYQPFSAFAGNPYFIDLDQLIEEGLLTADEVNGLDFGHNEERVDYEAQYNSRYRALRMAYDRFREKREQRTAEAQRADEECDNEASGRASDGKQADAAGRNALSYEDFIRENAYWLEDYALFTAIKAKNGGKSWLEWDEAEKERDPETLASDREELKEEIGFAYFVQWKFFSQWHRLRAYANAQGIRIIGDLPFYLAMDSADTWSHPEEFCFDRDRNPAFIAGCPPDAFSPTGQRWGNPVYDWSHEKKNHYAWWCARMQASLDLFDVVRIDHFHGFSEYYEIPYADETAENGMMKKGPGMDLFRTLKKKFGALPIIAEDLGTITPENAKLLANSGYPGMNVLQYAFDGSESSWYLPYNHRKNSVVYTGTHDNTTLRAWIEEINDHDRDFARRYIHSENTDYGAFVWDMIREAYRSVADICIIPLQDYLVLGKEARINSPGTGGGNWQWRLKPHFLSDDLARSILGLAKLYGRLPKENNAEKGGFSWSDASDSAKIEAQEA